MNKQGEKGQKLSKVGAPLSSEYEIPSGPPPLLSTGQINHAKKIVTRDPPLTTSEKVRRFQLMRIEKEGLGYIRRMAHLGGIATSKKYGSDHYQELQRKGEEVKKKRLKKKEDDYKIALGLLGQILDLFLDTDIKHEEIVSRSMTRIVKDIGKFLATVK